MPGRLTNQFERHASNLFGMIIAVKLRHTGHDHVYNIDTCFTPLACSRLTGVADRFHLVHVVPIDDGIERCVDPIEKFDHVDRFASTRDIRESNDVTENVTRIVFDLVPTARTTYLK